MKFNLFNILVVSIKKYRKPKLEDNWFESNYIDFKKLLDDNNEFPIEDNFPCLEERNDTSGTANGPYFHQDLFVAKQIYLNKPIKHVDIGSRIDGFIAHVAVFREIELLDIRKLQSKVKNIVFKQVDLMKDNLNYYD